MQNLLTAKTFTGNNEFALACDPVMIDSINNWYIPQYQYKYLNYLLGHTLYREFETALAGSPAQKWIDLRDGVTYQDYSDNGDIHYVKFEGVTDMLKYFIYYHIVKDLFGKETSPAQISSRNENSNRGNSYNKALEMFNVGIDKFGMVYNFKSLQLYNSSGFNTGYKNFIIEKDNVKLFPSAYNFIRRQNQLLSTTYENWIFTDLQYISLLTF